MRDDEMSDRELMLDAVFELDEVTEMVATVAPGWARRYILDEVKSSLSSCLAGDPDIHQVSRLARQWIDALRNDDAETLNALREAGWPLGERFDP